MCKFKAKQKRHGTYPNLKRWKSKHFSCNLSFLNPVKIDPDFGGENK